jgi:Carbohydrate family 9 binding domain-like
MTCWHTLVLTSLVFAVAAQASDYSAPRAGEPPVIDGDPGDPAWDAAPWQAIDQLILGSPPEPGDFSGRYKVVWDEQFLYVLAAIEDDVLHDAHADPLDQYWEDDTFEVLLDADRSGGDHHFNYNAFAYHIALDNQAVDIGPWRSEADRVAQRENRRTFPEHVYSRWQRRPEAVYWEVRLAVYGDDYRDPAPAQPAAAGPDPQPVLPEHLAPGRELGFMVAYCDSDQGSTRERFMTSVPIPLREGHRNWAYMDASVFGLLRLLP